MRLDAFMLQGWRTTPTGHAPHGPIAAFCNNPLAIPPHPSLTALEEALPRCLRYLPRNGAAVSAAPDVEWCAMTAYTDAIATPAQDAGATNNASRHGVCGTRRAVVPRTLTELEQKLILKTPPSPEKNP